MWKSSGSCKEPQGFKNTYISAYRCSLFILLRFKGGHWQNYTKTVFMAQQTLDPHLEVSVGGTGMHASKRPEQVCYQTLNGSG